MCISSLILFSKKSPSNKIYFASRKFDQLKTSNKIEKADKFRYVISRFLVLRVLDYTVPSGFDPNDSCRGQVHEYGLDFLELADRVSEQHDTEADKHLGEVWTR